MAVWHGAPDGTPVGPALSYGPLGRPQPYTSRRPWRPTPRHAGPGADDRSARLADATALARRHASSGRRHRHHPIERLVSRGHDRAWRVLRSEERSLLHAIACRSQLCRTLLGVVQERQAGWGGSLPTSRPTTPHAMPVMHLAEYGCRQRPTPHAASWKERAMPKSMRKA
jgi:hypothetical protein